MRRLCRISLVKGGLGLIIGFRGIFGLAIQGGLNMNTFRTASAILALLAVGFAAGWFVGREVVPPRPRYECVKVSFQRGSYSDSGVVVIDPSTGELVHSYPGGMAGGARK